MTSNKARVVRSAVAAAVIAAFAAGCSNDNMPKLAEAHAAPAPAVVQPGQRALPDFTALVEAAGPSVVNISVTRTEKMAGNMPDFSGIPEDSPMFEFFKRFGTPMPGPEGRGGPEAPERGRGLGLHHQRGRLRAHQRPRGGRCRHRDREAHRPARVHGEGDRSRQAHRRRTGEDRREGTARVQDGRPEQGQGR